MKPATPNPHPPGHVQQVKRGSVTRNLTAEERRRAQRVLLKMSVNVTVQGKPNAIHGHTHTVSENGAMLVLPEPLAENTKILIEHVKSQKTVEARVVRPPQMSSDGALVPVEFLAPSPGFWNIFFPPVVN
ncbi:MAG TPA: PilZ domain-containing protein [Candidatus Acidoferrales bacterium]|nr:PilZ domain-containing protein [Candidatus Acidoferrales bacterium]